MVFNNTVIFVLHLVKYGLGWIQNFNIFVGQ
jgi:hypothetical protein